jgi:hypothetical protein
MVYRTPNQDGWKVFDTGICCKQLTAEGVPKLDKDFPNSSSAVIVDSYLPNSSPLHLNHLFLLYPRGLWQLPFSRDGGYVGI